MTKPFGKKCFHIEYFSKSVYFISFISEQKLERLKLVLKAIFAEKSTMLSKILLSITRKCQDSTRREVPPYLVLVSETEHRLRKAELYIHRPPGGIGERNFISCLHSNTGLSVGLIYTRIFTLSLLQWVTVKVAQHMKNLNLNNIKFEHKNPFVQTFRVNNKGYL